MRRGPRRRRWRLACLGRRRQHGAAKVLEGDAVARLCALAVVSFHKLVSARRRVASLHRVAALGR